MDYVIVILFLYILTMLGYIPGHLLARLLLPMPNFKKAVKLYPVPRGLLGCTRFLCKSLKLAVLVEKKAASFRYKFYDNGIYVEEIVPIIMFYPFKIYIRAIFVPWECLSGPVTISVPIVLIPFIKKKYITFDIEGVDLAIGFSKEKSFSGSPLSHRITQK